MMKNLWITPFLLLTTPAFANSFIEQSKVDLTARNFYFDRDFQVENRYPALRDWSQGFIFKAQSGYTEGPIGFGIDILATAGFKLDGDAKYGGTGNLPRNARTNEPADQYGEIGITAKAKVAQTEVRIGTLQPMTPVLVGSPARLLPQTYRGVAVQSKDVQGLDLQASYIDKVNHRDSTNYENIKISGVNGRYRSVETDHLYYLGGHYDFNNYPLKLTAFHMDVEDLYHQSLLGVTYKHAFNEDTALTSQLRYYMSDADGAAKAGKVDNNLIHSHSELKHQNHKFILSTFHHLGDTAFPYLTGGETGLTIDTWTGEFLNAKERVYSARYEYDFKDYVPGLRFMTRYTHGSNIYAPQLGGTDFEEDELDFDIGYTVQNGPLKNLGLRARYAIYDNDMPITANIKPANETRINIDYTWKFK